LGRPKLKEQLNVKTRGEGCRCHGRQLSSFDAGIGPKDWAAADMIAVRVMGPMKVAVVGAPSYFDSMTEVALEREISLERILLHELIHRINNEFSSLIGAVSRTAAPSVNHEVKVALAYIIELLCHYAELHRALQMPERDTQIDAAT